MIRFVLVFVIALAVGGLVLYLERQREPIELPDGRSVSRGETTRSPWGTTVTDPDTGKRTVYLGATEVEGELVFSGLVRNVGSTGVITEADERALVGSQGFRAAEGLDGQWYVYSGNVIVPLWEHRGAEDPSHAGMPRDRAVGTAQDLTDRHGTLAAFLRALIADGYFPAVVASRQWGTAWDRWADHSGVIWWSDRAFAPYGPVAEITGHPFVHYKETLTGANARAFHAGRQRFTDSGKRAGNEGRFWGLASDWEGNQRAAILWCRARHPSGTIPVTEVA